ncbi:hypothetical protein KBI51_09550 [Aerococcaceae bacterium zg-ZUI334]|uniref:hypothetical protein n=1 Tax=Aerococcaceae bacterium zg-252 TaxID=2796928 RepID=UPI001B8ED255|nr:hypothetical protein [Aerococcaceae bacterium zg-ZUI334]
MYNPQEKQFYPDDPMPSGLKDWWDDDVFIGAHYYKIGDDVVVKHFLDDYIYTHYDVTDVIALDWQGEPISTGDAFILIDDEIIFEDDWEKYFDKHYPVFTAGEEY